MRFKAILSGALFAALSATSEAGAAPLPLTYDIDITDVASSVIGTITTDGMIGSLSDSDILSWNLTLTESSTSAIISPTSSKAFFNIVGSDLTATAATLNWSFTDSAHADELYVQGDSSDFILGTAAHCGSDESCLVNIVVAGVVSVPSDYTGSDVIGTVTTTPLPGSVALFGSALAGLTAFGFARRRKVGLVPDIA